MASREERSPRRTRQCILNCGERVFRVVFRAACFFLCVASSAFATPVSWPTRVCCHGCVIEAGTFALDKSDRPAKIVSPSEAGTADECARICHRSSFCAEFQWVPPSYRGHIDVVGDINSTDATSASCWLFRTRKWCAGRDRAVRPTDAVYALGTAVPIVGSCGTHPSLGISTPPTTTLTSLTNSSAHNEHTSQFLLHLNDVKSRSQMGLCNAEVWPRQCPKRLQPSDIDAPCGQVEFCTMCQYAPTSHHSSRHHSEPGNIMHLFFIF